MALRQPPARLSTILVWNVLVVFSSTAEDYGIADHEKCHLPHPHTVSQDATSLACTRYAHRHVASAEATPWISSGAAEAAAQDSWRQFGHEYLARVEAINEMGYVRLGGPLCGGHWTWKVPADGRQIERRFTLLTMAAADGLPVKIVVERPRRVAPNATMPCLVTVAGLYVDPYSAILVDALKSLESARVANLEMLSKELSN